MCGRFALYTTMTEVADRFRRQTGFRLQVEHQPPRYNIAPGTGIANITHSPDWSIYTFQWGFQPGWWQAGMPRPINARAEKVAVSPMFRHAFAHQRTLIPANGWYEWRRDGGGTRQPYYIRARDDDLIMLAGIASVPDDPDALPSCAIITEPARGPLGRIHDRMPVVLDPGCWQAWMDPALSDRDSVRGLLHRVDPGHYDIHPVSRTVNRPTNDAPDLIRPLSPA